MCLCPSTIPGSVSTSRSCSVSLCFCAKLRTCACANLMSSRSRLGTCPIARSTSDGASLNEVGDQLSNFSDNSRTAASLCASTSARICSTISRTLASAALIALASTPRLRWRGITFLLIPDSTRQSTSFKISAQSKDVAPEDKPGTSVPSTTAAGNGSQA